MFCRHLKLCLSTALQHIGYMVSRRLGFTVPLPSDWRAQQENYSTKVTIMRGDILYTKREEVAVIQNSLESKESVSIA